MTVEQFVERYYLHDSSLVKVDFDAEKNFLALTIEFCFWWQPWYNESEPPNGLIRVTFKNVSLFEYEDCIAEKIFVGIDSEIRIGDLDENGNLKIVAVEGADYADDDDIYYVLRINAASVDVEELERYTL